MQRKLPSNTFRIWLQHGLQCSSLAFRVTGFSIWLAVVQVWPFACLASASGSQWFKSGLLRVWLQHLARSVQAWPFACLAPASRSQCPSLFHVWLRHLTRGVEAWPFTRLASASSSRRRSLAFFASGLRISNILNINSSKT